MATGYEKYKTPFYEVQIVPAIGAKKPFKLPYQVHKLIQKVEIIRTFDKCFINDIINIHMIEGSREPYSSSDKVDTRELYPLETGSNDGITNRPGLLTDLRFSNSGTGITALDNLPIDINPGELVSDVAPEFPLSGDVSTPRLNIKKSTPGSGIKYLFQEGNYVIVTWGYLEDPKSVKKVASRITLIQTEFPENDHPRTNIVCQGPAQILDKLSAPIGRSFFTKIPAGVDVSSGKIMLKHKDIPTSTMIKQICQSAGIKCIINDTFDADTLEDGRAKKLPAGVSLHQFFKDLASRHNAYYMPFIDTDSLDTVISFINRTDFEKTTTIEDQNLFVYKGSGSILKSLSVKVDFGGITGATKLGYNADGELKGTVADNGGDRYLTLFEGQKLANSDATSYDQSAKKLAKSFKGGTTTGKAEVNPEADSNKNLDPLTQSSAACMSRIVALEFTTLGNTQIEPGQTILFQNIGDRYSGTYNVLTVNHILEPNSYICTGSANSAALSGGIGANTAYIPGDKIDTKRSVSLFEAAPKPLNNSSLPSVTGSLTGGSPKAEHDKKRK
jgi:hypothetical protein